MKLFWRIHIGNEADLLFTIPVGIPFWGLEEHETLIIYLFLPIISHREWRGTCNVRGSKLATGTARELNIDYMGE